MKIINQKPFLVFLDGADGVGKTTTCVELAKLIAADNFNVGITCVMRFTEIGALIREQAINGDNYNEYMNFLGFCYSTFHGVNTIYSKNEHSIIVVDRSQASTFAQNICSSSLDEQIKTSMLSIFNALNKEFIEKYKGHYVNYLLELDPAQALNRIKKQRDHFDNFEKQGIEFQQKIRNNFRLYFNQNNINVLSIDTTNITQEQVAKEIYKDLKEKLKCHILHSMDQSSKSNPLLINKKNN